MEARGRIPPTLPRQNPTVSYWHDPLASIANLRSTEELPQHADYVIVGSGVSGVCIAWNILEREKGAKVVMLEARTAVGGATGRNGGHTKAASYRSYINHATAHGTTEAIRIAHLEAANIAATHAFAKSHSIPCESRPCETVDVIYDAASYAAGVQAIGRMQADMGPHDPSAQYKTYDAESARKTFLTPGEDVQGAFAYPAGSLSSYKFAIGILNLCLARGLNLQTMTPVTGIRGATPSSGVNGRWTAATPRGSISTPKLILATNGYTAHLLPSLLGSIVPYRGQVIASAPSRTLESIVPSGLPTTYSFIYASGYEYMIPRPHHSTSKEVPADCQGDIVIGGGTARLPGEGVSEFGNTDDTVINELNSPYLRQTLPSYFGENWGDAKATPVKKEWTGIMGATKDGLPFVGGWPGAEGLWVSAGFNGHGMVLCLKCAEALVGMVFGEKVEGGSLDWFPRSFLLSSERVENGTFEGRVGMRAVSKEEEGKFQAKL
ncbi:FAD dependent oxidoreductase [Rhizodiscina lignyota]|uniref:FAD dependent oxidoreductase n=1 Tax=Rhizodiscina lignyota TaxID=1504668 RepID=A0A9P4MER5_9PEZI|nr:FAD dependent oxidoreductase [Rhizodiscina lignyota]